MEHFDWWKYSGYDAIFTLLGGEYSIFQGSVTQPRHLCHQASKHGSIF